MTMYENDKENSGNLCNDSLQDPTESGEKIAAQLEEAVDLIMSVVKELRSLEGKR